MTRSIYERQHEILFLQNLTSNKITKENIKFLDLKNIKIRKKNIYKGISEKNLDMITLDLKEPWNVIAPAHKALKRGAFLVIYTPQITQALSCVNKIKNKLKVTLFHTITGLLGSLECENVIRACK